MAKRCFSIRLTQSIEQASNVVQCIYNSKMFAHHTALELQHIAVHLSDSTGFKVRLLAQIDSTNQALLNEAAQLPIHPQAPCAMMALEQSAGRGRRGRAWTVQSDQAHQQFDQTECVSPAFLASMGICSTLPLQALSMLPLHVGVAVVETLRAWGCSAQLKWPNDVVIATPKGLAKLGGILLETRQLSTHHTAIVIGMGLNWHGAPTIANALTSHVLAHTAAPAPDAAQASASLLKAMGLAWQRCVEGCACDFASHDALRNQLISVHESAAQADLKAPDTLHESAPQGMATGINAQGHLGVHMLTGAKAGQLLWLHSGEVSVRAKAVTAA